MKPKADAPLDFLDDVVRRHKPKSKSIGIRIDDNLYRLIKLAKINITNICTEALITAVNKEEK